jgi:hypothetical protein
MDPQKHAHPFWYIALFLAIALGALVLILANTTAPDTGAGGSPGVPSAMDCPQGEPQGFELSDVEGQQLSDVEDWAAGKGWTVRVVSEDGQPMAVTMDYNPERLNVQVESDVVIRYCGNG